MSHVSRGSHSNQKKVYISLLRHTSGNGSRAVSAFSEDVGGTVRESEFVRQDQDPDYKVILAIGKGEREGSPGLGRPQSPSPKAQPLPAAARPAAARPAAHGAAAHGAGKAAKTADSTKWCSRQITGRSGTHRSCLPSGLAELPFRFAALSVSGP